MRCALNICALMLLLGVASAFSVSGNKLLDANGNPILLRGIARPSFEWNKDGQFASLADYTLMKNWGSNVVRLGLSQCFWLESDTAAAYKATIDQQVQWIKSLGMAVIIDLHWSNKNAASGGCGQQVMADGNSITFWTQVANKYKSDTSILFELYNEPHDVPWSVWLNGGDAGAGFTVVGMQQLYNTVRGTGATNVVIVSGLNYAYDLSGIPQYALTGNNIMYNTHPYDFGGKQPADWPTGFGFLAANYALIATEFGEFNCNPTFNQQFVNYANQYSISWTAWGWFVQGCGFPSLISDWSGTPAATAVPVKCDLMYTQKIPGNTTQIGGSCSGSSSTTGGSGSTNGGGVGNGVNITLYADSVQVYTDYTWASGSPSDTTFKHSGSYSYSWTPSSYKAMYFYSAGAVSTTKYRGLEFWVHGGTTGNQNINFNIVQGSPTATKIGPDLSVASYIGANSIPTSWRRGFVDFSNFPAGNYDGVWFQSTISGTDGVVYFDDIVLVAYPPATTTAGANAATTTAGGSATTTTSSKAASTSSTAGVSTSTTTSTTTTTTTTTSTTSTSTTSTSTTAASATTSTSSRPATTSTSASNAGSSTSASNSASSTTASNAGSSTSAANSATTSTSSRPATSSTSTNAASATTSTSSRSTTSTTNAAATTTTAANAASSSTAAGPAATTGTPATSSTSSRPGTTSTSAQSTAATSASSGTTQNAAATTTAKGASTTSPAATTTSKGASTASSASTTQSASSTATSAVTPPGPTVTTTTTGASCEASGAAGCTCSTDANCNPNLFCVFGKCQADSAIVDSHSSTLKHSILFVIAGVGALMLM